jgi:2-polyprenyl-3-methyl-5-hydroxy-6-metoxy-1,4-benzoquinol methylase
MNGTSRQKRGPIAVTKADLPRNLDLEYADLEDRNYAYDFDYRMHHYFLRRFEPYFLGSNVLELGCYKGEFTRLLADRFTRVTTVEGASSLIEIARKIDRDNVEFIHSRFENFQPSAGFDSIFLIHTLEHLDNPVEVLALIRTWLAPGGRLYLAVPNAFAASRQIAVAMGLIDEPTAVTEGEALHGHRRTYDRSTLLDHVAQAGLRTVTEGGVFYKPFANFQFDQLLRSGAVSEAYLEGCYTLSLSQPEFSASLFAICEA